MMSFSFGAQRRYMPPVERSEIRLKRSGAARKEHP
jgi:hypothetical protein